MAYAADGKSSDFNGDGKDDLVIGVNSESVGITLFAGDVNVLYGLSSSGLAASNNQLWNQDVSRVEETAEPFDFFGFALSGAN